MRSLLPLSLLLVAPTLAAANAGPASNVVPANAGEEAFESAKHWTVQIRTSVSRPFTQDEMGSFQGAGLVVDAKRGWVLTNAHVASSSYSHMTVTFYGGEPIPAQRLYVDPHLDLAVVAYDPAKVGRTPAEPELDCDASPPIGHPVGAFGHPWGFRFTGTRGITSAVTSRLGPQMLQTDAPINSGNSGGSLISLVTGRVVGVNAASMSKDRAEGISFAVPMFYGCTIIDLLEKGEDPSPPAGLVDFAIDENDEPTLTVARSRLPAGAIDLRAGDELLALRSPDRALENQSALVHALRGKLDDVSLLVRRDGKEITLHGNWPAAPHVIERQGLWISGALIAEAEPLFRGQILGGPTLMIHHIQSGSPAQVQDLQEYDLVLSANGHAVDSLETLQRLAREAEANKSELSLMLLRLGSVRNGLFAYQQRTLRPDDIELVGPPSDRGASRLAGAIGE
jgi:S1-C subfamily serine protease